MVTKAPQLWYWAYDRSLSASMMQTFKGRGNNRPGEYPWSFRKVKSATALKWKHLKCFYVASEAPQLKKHRWTTRSYHRYESFVWLSCRDLSQVELAFVQSIVQSKGANQGLGTTCKIFTRSYEHTAHLYWIFTIDDKTWAGSKHGNEWMANLE